MTMLDELASIERCGMNMSASQWRPDPTHLKLIYISTSPFLPVASHSLSIRVPTIFISMSSSRSSCSSVKNPYNNSNSIMSRKKYNSDFEYRFSGIKCKCDLESPCQEAWKEGTMDPGIRFFGCSQYLVS